MRYIFLETQLPEMLGIHQLFKSNQLSISRFSSQVPPGYANMPASCSLSLVVLFLPKIALPKQIIGILGLVKKGAAAHMCLAFGRTFTVERSEDEGGL
jgi:hypothetical protein